MKEYVIFQDKDKKPYLKETADIRITEDEDTTVEDVITTLIFRKSFHKLAAENGYVFAYNKNNKLLGSFLLSVGSQNRCTIFERTLFTFLILVGADTFYYLHNHPVGTHRPSGQDIESSNYLADLAKKLDMTLEDSIIVSSNGFYFINKDKSIDWTDEDVERFEDIFNN